MFRDKLCHVELKKDEAAFKMVLIVATKSQEPRLALSQENEP
jgi:hypothetical protein